MNCITILQSSTLWILKHPFVFELQAQICCLCLVMHQGKLFPRYWYKITCDQHQNHSKSAVSAKVPPSLTIHLGFAPASHAKINHTTAQTTEPEQSASINEFPWMNIWNLKKIRFIPDSAPKIWKETNMWIAVICCHFGRTLARAALPPIPGISSLTHLNCRAAFSSWPPCKRVNKWRSFVALGIILWHILSLKMSENPEVSFLVRTYTIPGENECVRVFSSKVVEKDTNHQTIDFGFSARFLRTSLFSTWSTFELLWRFSFLT